MLGDTDQPGNLLVGSRIKTYHDSSGSPRNKAPSQ